MQGNGFQDLHFEYDSRIGSYNMEYKESIEGASKSFGNFFFYCATANTRWLPMGFRANSSFDAWRFT